MLPSSGENTAHARAHTRAHTHTCSASDEAHPHSTRARACENREIATISASPLCVVTSEKQRSLSGEWHVASIAYAASNLDVQLAPS